MPGLDKTGPRGLGARTGRGLGPCGCGKARGFGRRCIGAPLNLSKEEEKKILEENLKDLEAEKEAIKNRLKEL